MPSAEIDLVAEEPGLRRVDIAGRFLPSDFAADVQHVGERQRGGQPGSPDRRDVPFAT